MYLWVAIEAHGSLHIPFRQFPLRSLLIEGVHVQPQRDPEVLGQWGVPLRQGKVKEEALWWRPLATVVQGSASHNHTAI